MKQRIQIKDIPHVYIDNSDFEGDINIVSQNILNIKKKLKLAHKEREDHNYNSYDFVPFSQYETIIIERDYYDDGLSFSIKVYREETDAEYKDRLQKEDDFKKKQKEATLKRQKTIEEKELNLLKKLKEKYETKNNSK